MMDEGLIVRTSAGSLAGAKTAGVRRWLGVPYARAERFGAPEPVPPWTGLRPATRFAPQCPQIFGSNPKYMQVDPPRYAEDGCLALNIWAPDHEPERPRPVFFWIHGGAFTLGGSNVYDGAELARMGDIIVVGINYRLGVLGFVDFATVLADPSIPSNLGLRDQIAALRWVHDNIAAFGGDPARVTIAGESAGSISVSMLMVCRAAWPLFQGAVMQSGALSLVQGRRKSLETAQHYAELLELRPGPGALERLRALDLRALLATQGRLNGMKKASIAAAPWFDGDLLPPTLHDALVHPHAPVPLIAGATREEVRLFEVLPGNILPTSWRKLEGLVEMVLPPQAARRVLESYPRTKKGRRALATDLVFAMPTRQFAETHARDYPTWVYRFDYRHPLLGAYHAIDLLFLWPGRGLSATLARGGRQTGKRLALANRMRTYWSTFTKLGAPGGDWPQYRLEDRQVLLFGKKQDRVVANPDGERVGAWEGTLVNAVAERVG